MVISFGIKDSITNVINLARFLINASNPEDILEENSKTKVFLRRYEEINKKYQVILKKSEQHIAKDMVFFTYSGDLSINQYVSNELFYKHPDKVIVTVYTKGNIANLSLRWKGDIRTATVNAIKDIEGASGGGHEHATGARMPADKIQEFKEKLLNEIDKIKSKKS
jgi:nanoRNase/pAp phosphatase (c-di-AMP/oligoRNAs hydrolase)